MSVQRMDHVGVVVSDLPAASEFFKAHGLSGIYRLCYVRRPDGIIVEPAEQVEE